MQWIDLSPYGMKLLVVDLPTQDAGRASRVLVMQNGDRQAAQIAKLGFRKDPNSGAWVLMGATPSFAAIEAVLPEAKRLPDAKPEEFYRKIGAKPAPQPIVPAPRPEAGVPEGGAAAPRPVAGEPAPAEPPRQAGAKAREAREDDEPKKEEVPVEVLLAQSRFLGLNRLGQSVYQNVRGRFMQDTRGKVVFETEMAAVGPGLFLRAADEPSLAIAAEGFVEEIAQGKILRFDDLKRFASAVFGEEVGDEDPRLVRAHTAVEGALARWLARKGGTSMRDIFGGAMKLHEGHPYLGDLVRHQKGVASPMPQPVSVVVQRILGTDAELNGKNIVVTGAGTGTLFAHLPRGAQVRVFETDKARAVHAKATMSAAARPPEALVETAPDYAAADMVIANLERALLDKPRSFEGLSVGRADLAEMLDSLAARQPGGRSVFVLRGGQTPEEREEMERVRAYVAARYAIEGTVDIDGGLHSGRAEAEPMRLLVVGRRRPAQLSDAPEPAMRLSEVHDFLKLWSWTTEVVANRAKIEEHYALDADAMGDGNVDPTLAENSYQAPYVAMSGIGQASTMVPRNLEGATREALGRVARKHQDVDQWIANELAMTREQMEERFSPEQVDALALAIDAEERGRAFLNADQTGIGKGRFLAALMRRAAMQGKKVLFLTEKEINLSDIVRDIRHTGSEAEFSTLVMNDGAEIIDEVTGDVLMRAPKRDVVQEVMATRQWPADFNLVMATYSQFNKPGVQPEPKRNRRRARAGEADAAPAPAPQEVVQISDKSAWLREAIDEDTIVILDECHNVSSGTSTSSLNVSEAVRKAGGVVFSSATYAKAAKNFGIYAKLFPPGFDTENLTEVMRKGGETLQETLSAMLVKDGVMVRREHDLSKCDFSVVTDEENVERNRQYMNTLAPILAEMAYLAGDLDRQVNAMNDAVERQLRQRLGDNDRAVRERMKSLQTNRIGFGSPLYNLSRLFLCSLLVDKASNEAIEALRNNQKPVILVENTIQSVLEELAQGQDQVEGDVVPDFKDLLRRTLGQLTRISRPGPNGQRQIRDLAQPEPELDTAEELINRMVAALPEGIARADQDGVEGEPEFKAVMERTLDRMAQRLRNEVPETDIEAFGAALARVRRMIEALPDTAKEAAPGIRRLAATLPETSTRAVRRIRALIDAMPDLPVSAIDEVRDRIEAAGFSCEEITGRSWECRGGRIARRAAVSKTEVKNRFNSGATDAVIINTAGSTGIDLHAGRRFLDQRQRILIELQAPADITKQIQAYGRVNRFDQVIGPKIRSLMAGLPIELRLMAMRNAKLRRMSANVTSNRDNSALIKDIPDLINAVGDIVCTRYAEARPDLMRRLGFEVERNAKLEAKNADAANAGAAEDEKDNQRSANEFLARLAMLPVPQQEQTINELDAEYRATLEELDARGENPLKSKTLDGIVHPREKTVFDGANVENPTSEFHRPVFAQRVIVEHTVEPLRGEQVAAEFEKGLVALGAEGPEAYADRIARNRERLLEQYLPRDAANVQDALAQNHPVLTEMNRRLDQLIDVLGKLKPGSEMSLSMDGVAETGVVTYLHMPRRGYDHLASAYDVEFILPGTAMPKRVSLSALLRDEKFAVSDGLNGEDYDAILAKFDRALEGSRLEPRTLLVGNDWQAMNLSIQHKLGSMVAWEDEKGIRYRGVLVSKKHANLDFLPVSMRNARMAAAAVLENAAEVYGSSDLNGTGIAVKLLKDGRYCIHMPNPRSKKHGFIYEHPPVQALLQRLNHEEDEKNPKMIVNRDVLEIVLGHLADAGARFYASSRHREWANRWMAANYQDAPEVANPQAAPAAAAPRAA